MLFSSSPNNNNIAATAGFDHSNQNSQGPQVTTRSQLNAQLVTKSTPGHQIQLTERTDEQRYSETSTGLRCCYPGPSAAGLSDILAEATGNVANLKNQTDSWRKRSQRTPHSPRPTASTGVEAVFPCSAHSPAGALAETFYLPSQTRQHRRQRQAGKPSRLQAARYPPQPHLHLLPCLPRLQAYLRSAV